MKLDKLLNTPASEIESSGYVVDSIEAAVWCLIQTDNLKDCLLKAVNLGRDTDYRLKSGDLLPDAEK